MKYDSAYNKLSLLPEVFCINDMAKILKIPKKQTKTYLNRWVKFNFIKKFSPRSGIFFNLLKSSTSAEDNFNKALYTIYPDAIFTGPAVLRDFDYTTQISNKAEIIVLKRPSYQQIDGVNILPRSRSWYKQFHQGILTQGGKRILRPEYILADGVLNPDKQWLPDPDDLDLDENNIKQVISVFQSLEVALPENYKKYFYSFLQKDELSQFKYTNL